MELLEMLGSTILEINLDNLAYNIKATRKYINKDTLIMAIVKANAYGHGAIASSRIFLENGADRLGVSILREGIELRKAGIEAPILLLNYTPQDQYKYIVEYDLIQTIYRYEDAEALSKVALSMGKTMKIHIKIDTGMSRIGFLPGQESIEAIVKISKLPNIEIEGIFTHFAKADEIDKTFTHIQFNRFIDLVNELEEKGVDIAIKHVANSATVIDMAEYNLDMVRPGLILYGHYPSEEVQKENLFLRPAMTLKSRISNIKTIDKGEGVGYNHSYIAKKKTHIATIPIGYADGYSRMLAERSYVSVDGEKAEVVGKVCMDQIMVDVSHIENVEVGDEAILFGCKEKGSPSLDETANWIGTLNYDILCMISRRVPRIYTEKDEYKYIVDYILD